MIHSAKSLITIQDGIANGSDFDIASMSGRVIDRTDYVPLGRLPHPYREQFALLHSADDLDYVVMSYYTPIAWRTENGVWIIPPITYSATTTRHQSIVRRYVDVVNVHN